MRPPSILTVDIDRYFRRTQTELPVQLTPESIAALSRRRWWPAVGRAGPVTVLRVGGRIFRLPCVEAHVARISLDQAEHRRRCVDCGHPHQAEQPEQRRGALAVRARVVHKRP